MMRGSEKKAFGVVGAGWGDEGKGLATDALTAQLVGQGRQVTVVRSNGGAQAGHGVTMDDGRHHVFHHIGSGSFRDAATHLSRFFVSHPMVFFAEMEDLARKGVEDLQITADPRSVITTPWDMAINQAVEIARGAGKHGSCGLGFGEALERHENGLQLTMQDLFSPGLMSRLEQIASVWVPARLAALGLTDIPDHLSPVLSNASGFVGRFSQDLHQYRAVVALMSDDALGDRDAVVFEGAQGLQLDMDLGVFPHVTRSHTGAKSMVEIARDAGITDLEIIYMTRAYATRHGAGPFPLDRGTAPLPGTNVIDRTNTPNEWQDAIRYAPLDLRELDRIITADLARSSGQGVTLDHGLGVTCLDQLGDKVLMSVMDMGEGPYVSEIDTENLADVIAGLSGHPLKLKSEGPCAENVDLSLLTPVPQDEPSP